MNLDGFYKEARNLIDLGQFGSAVILSPYNYRHGTVYGAEASSTYKIGSLSLFGNLAFVYTQAEEVTSQQFEFDPDELTYINHHYVHLDHESDFTSSAGASYSPTKNDLVYVDFLYGSGLRAGFANTLVEPSHYPINIGYQHVFPPHRDEAGGQAAGRCDERLRPAVPASGRQRDWNESGRLGSASGSFRGAVIPILVVSVALTLLRIIRCEVHA